jgi:rubrerythrin
MPYSPNSYVARLSRLAAAYRKAEGEVVTAFFTKPRKPKDHVRWLKAQGFKEYSAIKPILAALTALYSKLDRGVSRHDYAELTEKLADETRHARLVMDLLQKITGKKIASRDLTWLREDRKLARVRAKYSKSYAGLLHGSEKITSKELSRRDEALERAALTLTEGGGGALYEVCGKLKKKGIEGNISRVFGEILRDEVSHKDSGARALAPLVNNEASFKRAAEIIGEVSGQRLRMRNEQFGFPLPPKRLAEIDRRARRAGELS